MPSMEDVTRSPCPLVLRKGAFYAEDCCLHPSYAVHDSSLPDRVCGPGIGRRLAGNGCGRAIVVPLRLGGVQAACGYHTEGVCRIFTSVPDGGTFLSYEPGNVVAFITWVYINPQYRSLGYSVVFGQCILLDQRKISPEEVVRWLDAARTYRGKQLSARAAGFSGGPVRACFRFRVHAGNCFSAQKGRRPGRGKV